MVEAADDVSGAAGAGGEDVFGEDPCALPGPPLLPAPDEPVVDAEAWPGVVVCGAAVGEIEEGQLPAAGGDVPCGAPGAREAAEPVPDDDDATERDPIGSVLRPKAGGLGRRGSSDRSR